MVLTDSPTGDPDAQLEGEAVEIIRRHAADRIAAERGVDAVSSQAVTDWLEAQHPLSGCMSLSRQWHEYLTRTSAGRAIWLVNTGDIALLRETVARLHLPIDVEVMQAANARYAKPFASRRL